MLPFITIFNRQIPMYGLLIMAGVSLGVSFAVFFPAKKHIARQDIFNAVCYAGVGVFAGAKLLYIVLTLPELFFAQNAPALTWELVYRLFAYGFVFYGGVLGGLFGIFLYACKYKLAFLPLTETLIPAVPLVHAVGRIGCFCAGCCYGVPMEPPWGVYFHADSVALHGVPLFPVQLYEAALNVVLFIGLFAYSRKERRPGQILGLYLLFYALIRFTLEYFRFDAARGFLLGISTSQWISLLLLPVGLCLLLAKRKTVHSGAGQL